MRSKSVDRRDATTFICARQYRIWGDDIHFVATYFQRVFFFFFFGFYCSFFCRFIIIDPLFVRHAGEITFDLLISGQISQIWRHIVEFCQLKCLVTKLIIEQLSTVAQVFGRSRQNAMALFCFVHWFPESRPQSLIRYCTHSDVFIVFTFSILWRVYASHFPPSLSPSTHPFPLLCLSSGSLDVYISQLCMFIQ